MFDDVKFDEKCDCGGRLSFTVQDIANERTVRCSRGCSVQLKDNGGGAQSARRAGRDLDQALNRLSRTFKI